MKLLPFAVRGLASGVPRQAALELGSILRLLERSTSFKESTFVFAAQFSRASVYIENIVTAVSSLELRKLPELCVWELVDGAVCGVDGITRSSGVAINTLNEQCAMQ